MRAIRPLRPAVPRGMPLLAAAALCAVLAGCQRQGESAAGTPARAAPSQALRAGIQGYISPAMPLASTTVTLQQPDGSVVRAAVPEASGRFTMAELPPGSYTLVVAAEGHALAVVQSVPVGTGMTSLNAAQSALLAPTSTMAEVTGTAVLSAREDGGVATPAGAAQVRAVQTLTGATVIEAGKAAVDAELGAWRMRLPLAAPLSGPWQRGAAPRLAPDGDAAGVYTLQAATAGRETVQRTLDLRTPAQPPVVFPFSP